MAITVNLKSSNGKEQDRIILNNIKRLLALQSTGFRMLEFNIGVQKGFFNAVSEGKETMTSEIISRISHVLNVSYNELMKEQINGLYWKRKYPLRSKSQIFTCPVCKEDCYCFGECYYRYCPNCGEKIMK